MGIKQRDGLSMRGRCATLPSVSFSFLFNVTPLVELADFHRQRLTAVGRGLHLPTVATHFVRRLTLSAISMSSTTASKPMDMPQVGPCATCMDAAWTPAGQPLSTPPAALFTSPTAAPMLHLLGPPRHPDSSRCQS